MVSTVDKPEFNLEEQRQRYLEYMIRHCLRRRPENAKQTQRGKKKKVRR